MSSSAAAAPTTIWLGLDVHKESVTIAVLRGDAATPDRVNRLPNDLPKLKRYLERLRGQGPLRAVYEASGAGYVRHRACTAWGVPCRLHQPPLCGPAQIPEVLKPAKRSALTERNVHWAHAPRNHRVWLPRDRGHACAR